MKIIILPTAAIFVDTVSTKCWWSTVNRTMQDCRINEPNPPAAVAFVREY